VKISRDLPYVVIGHYIPERWSIKLVTRKLEKISREAGFTPLPIGKHRLHKGPYQNNQKHSDLMRRQPKNDTADMSWHQDGDMSGAEMDCSLVLWTTRVPTEFLFRNKVYQPEKYEVVVANNLACKHRRPENAPRVRWFFRQRVYTPEWLKL
jgi:hypothetical protein